MLIQILLEKNVLLSELCDIIRVYPQVLLNAHINNEKKYNYKEDEDIQNKIKLLQNEFLNAGRVIVRASGTEPLIRVMIEGEKQKYITDKAKELISLIEEKLK